MLDGTARGRRGNPAVPSDKRGGRVSAPRAGLATEIIPDDCTCAERAGGMASHG